MTKLPPVPVARVLGDADLLAQIVADPQPRGHVEIGGGADGLARHLEQATGGHLLARAVLLQRLACEDGFAPPDDEIQEAGDRYFGSWHGVDLWRITEYRTTNYEHDRQVAIGTHHALLAQANDRGFQWVELLELGS